jgi:hypothetical protein
VQRALSRLQLIRALLLAACLALPGAAAAQSPPALLDAYGRTVALLDFMTSYVGESLLACAERGFLEEGQAEGRFRAYRERNAALLGRAERWRKEAEERLRAQGEERAALERAGEAGGTATAMALARVREEMDKVRDLRALCAGKVEAIAAGRYDLSLNSELVNLLQTKP